MHTNTQEIQLEMGRAFEFRKARKMKRWSAMAKKRLQRLVKIL